MEMDNEINVSMPANTTPILKHVVQGVISTFKFYYLRNTFCKATAAMMIPLMDLGKVIENHLWFEKDSPF